LKEDNKIIGLTSAQVKNLKEAGKNNFSVKAPSKTNKEIIKENTLTYFNLVFLVISILLILVGIIVIPCIKVVPQSKVYVVERLGSYYTAWHNGVHFKIPFIDRIANVVLLKEMVRDFDPQHYVTLLGN